MMLKPVQLMNRLQDVYKRQWDASLVIWLLLQVQKLRIRSMDFLEVKFPETMQAFIPNLQRIIQTKKLFGGPVP